MVEEQGDNWIAHRLLILSSLQRIEVSVKSQADEINKLTNEVNILKTKIVILGIAASVLVSATVTVVTNALSK